MTALSTLFPDTPLLLGRKWFKQSGNFDQVVPASAKWCRLHMRAAGGFGDSMGGGGAFVRHRFAVTVGENLKIQVGNTSTASAAGDSFVTRNDGTPIAYAERGRGNGAAGLAANSTGELKRDGTAGTVGSPQIGGKPGDDSADTIQMFGPGEGLYLDNTPSGAPPMPGGGGKLHYYGVEDGVLRLGYPGGFGIICLEWFDGKPPL